MRELLFLKLGGSLITDKTIPYTPRLEKIAHLAAQIARFRAEAPHTRLVLGHGSGSFGHTAARQYKTRGGLNNSGLDAVSYWRGFGEVWFQASALNRFVMDCLHAAGVAAIAFSPVAAVATKNGQVAEWNLAPLRGAMEAGLVPVVYGDVIFDQALGGTILSTEDLFEHLARQLRPERILLAGLEAAVWADFPAREERVEKISPASFAKIRAGVGNSHGADVTGGMHSKVEQMLKLAQEIPGLSAQIFSGEEAGNLEKALRGEAIGTIIAA